MDSVASAVSASLALEQAAQAQEKDNLLLRKVLDNQAQTITNLVDSVPNANRLADVGPIGTLLHATA